MTPEQNLQFTRELAVALGYPEGAAGPAFPHFHDNPAMAIRFDDTGTFGLMLNFDGWRMEGKLRVSGLQPRYRTGQTATGGQSSIQCTYGRGTAAAAKDIQRRFLPDYLDAHRKALATIAETHSKWDTLNNAARALAKALGVSDDAIDHRDVYQPRVLIPCKARLASGEMRVTDGGREVTVELRWVPVELALRVAAVIREFNEQTTSN